MTRESAPQGGAPRIIAATVPIEIEATTEVRARVDAARVLAHYGLLQLLNPDDALEGVAGHLARVELFLRVAVAA